MPTITRSALVQHSATRMFSLVNAVAAYPQRFAWCSGARVLEADASRMLARLELGIGGIRTWFTTANMLVPPQRIDMELSAAPFRTPARTSAFHALAHTDC